MANFLQMVLFVEGLKELMGTTAAGKTDGARIVAMGSFTSMQAAKGMLDFEHLHSIEGQNDKMGPCGYVYVQTKLMQHVWVKAAHGDMPPGVSLNITCPGAAPSSIPAWEDIKRKMACAWGTMFWLAGFRSLEVGIQPMLHMCGSPAVAGLSGKFCDWGIFNKLVKREPVDCEFYPTQGKKAAPTTADPAQVQRLKDVTAKIVVEMQGKYGSEY